MKVIISLILLCSVLNVYGANTPALYPRDTDCDAGNAVGANSMCGSDPGTVCLTDAGSEADFLQHESKLDNQCERGKKCYKVKYFLFSDAGSGDTRIKVFKGTEAVAGQKKFRPMSKVITAGDAEKLVADIMHWFLNTDDIKDAKLKSASKAQRKKLLSYMKYNLMATAGGRVAEHYREKPNYIEFNNKWGSCTQGAGASNRASGQTISGRLEGVFGAIGGHTVAKQVKYLFMEVGGASIQWNFPTKVALNTNGKPERSTSQRKGMLIQLKQKLLGPTHLKKANEEMKLAGSQYGWSQSMNGPANDRMLEYVLNLCSAGSLHNNCPCAPDDFVVEREKAGSNYLATGKPIDAWAWGVNGKDAKVFKSAPQSVHKIEPSSDRANRFWKCADLVEEVLNGKDESGLVTGNPDPRVYSDQYRRLRNAIENRAENLNEFLFAGASAFFSLKGGLKLKPNGRDGLLWFTSFTKFLEAAKQFSESTLRPAPKSFSGLVGMSNILVNLEKMGIIKKKDGKAKWADAKGWHVEHPFTQWHVRVGALDWDAAAAPFLSKLDGNTGKVYSTDEVYDPDTAKEDRFWVQQ